MAEKNIYQRMSAITAEMETVAKNLSVSAGKGASYKAVSEADVLAAVKPLEEKHGIYSYPVSRKVLDSGELVTESEYNGKTTKSVRLFLRVETIYRFVNVDNPSEYLETTTYGDGVDSQDKGPGKAMTYADKYALLKAYKISTGDDPDKDASEPLQSVWRGRSTKISLAKAQSVKKWLEDNNVSVEGICNQYKVATLSDLTEAQVEDIARRLEAAKK